MTLKVEGGTVEFRDGMVHIRRNARGRLASGHGDTQIRADLITSIDHRPAGFVGRGYVIFHVAGSTTTLGTAGFRATGAMQSPTAFAYLGRSKRKDVEALISSVHAYNASRA